MAGVVHSRAVVCPSCSSCWFNYRQRHRRRNATTPCVESPFIGVLTAPLNRGEDDALAIGPVSTRVSATPSPRKRTPVMIDRSRGSVGAVHGDLTRVLAEGTLCIYDTNAPQNCYQFLLTVLCHVVVAAIRVACCSLFTSPRFSTAVLRKCQGLHSSLIMIRSLGQWYRSWHLE